VTCARQKQKPNVPLVNGRQLAPLGHAWPLAQRIKQMPIVAPLLMLQNC
jgi:hypothetical protein